MSGAPWTVVFAAETINDLLLITDYLTQAYCGFGEPLAEAHSHAQVRIEAIITWLSIVLCIGFAHALSSGKSRCWLFFLVAKTSSAACWCACCKTAPRFELASGMGCGPSKTAAKPMRWFSVANTRPAAGGTNPCPGAGCDWLSFQAHARSIRKKPGFFRMISPIDAELVP